MINKAVKYLSDVQTEMSKVIWPTKAQLRDSAVIVVVLSVALAIFVFVIDFVLNGILKIIF